MLRSLILVAILSAFWVRPLTAQNTNMDVLGGLAVKCLGDIPGPVDTFRVNAGRRMPFLRPYLTRHWLSRGYKVFLPDSVTNFEGPNPIHELRYDAESADVSYERAERDSLRRTIRLTIAHSFISPGGRLVEEARCQDAVSDTILAKDVPLVQGDSWEETHGTVPLNRSWRTWAEPAVIGTSIAVVVYLFFSVRS